jgi:hypothetical protein
VDVTLALGQDVAAWAVVGIAAVYLGVRAARLFRRPAGGCGCSSEGKPGCPAVGAANDLRAAARRAVKQRGA